MSDSRADFNSEEFVPALALDRRLSEYERRIRDNVRSLTDNERRYLLASYKVIQCGISDNTATLADWARLIKIREVIAGAWANVLADEPSSQEAKIESARSKNLLAIDRAALKTAQLSAVGIFAGSGGKGAGSAAPKKGAGVESKRSEKPKTPGQGAGSSNRPC